jgi:hypothetical protein
MDSLNDGAAYPREHSIAWGKSLLPTPMLPCACFARGIKRFRKTTGRHADDRRLLCMGLFFDIFIGRSRQAAR